MRADKYAVVSVGERLKSLEHVLPGLGIAALGGEVFEPNRALAVEAFSFFKQGFDRHPGIAHDGLVGRLLPAYAVPGIPLTVNAVPFEAAFVGVAHSFGQAEFIGRVVGKSTFLKPSLYTRLCD